MKQDPEEIPAKTVDEYLAAVPEETRTVLENLRSTIKAVAPEAEEVISYRIPTYKYHGALVHFAAFMDHCSFIVVSRSILEKFRNELRPYATSGTTIHFSAEHPLPATLIGDIVRTGMTENEALWKSLLKKGSPPCASPTPVGGGACDSSVLPEILIPVIQHNRNRAATAAGRSPWSVIRKEVFYRPKMKREQKK